MRDETLRESAKGNAKGKRETLRKSVKGPREDNAALRKAQRQARENKQGVTPWEREE